MRQAAASGHRVRPLFTHDVDGDFTRGWYCQRYFALQQSALAWKLGVRSSPRSAPGAAELLRLLRDLPQFACVACGVLVDRDRAVEAIMRLVPDADLGLLAQLCDRSAACLRDRDESVLVEQIFDVNDDLYRAVSQRMFDHVRANG
jgi:hypothetical protein